MTATVCFGVFVWAAGAPFSDTDAGVAVFVAAFVAWLFAAVGWIVMTTRRRRWRAAIAHSGWTAVTYTLGSAASEHGSMPILCAWPKDTPDAEPEVFALDLTRRGVRALADGGHDRLWLARGPRRISVLATPGFERLFTGRRALDVFDRERWRRAAGL
ncbi:MAG TPA: hypothetical protein VN238_11325 [Solirubrobacteraceae bacterium]|nr:hypothetical protein [Solirubrobacteraceae bacterium]